jgi:hypothetical protein
MWWWLGVALAFVSGVVCTSLLWSRELRRREQGLETFGEAKLPFHRSDSILSDSELSVYRMLHYVVGDDGYLLAKTRLADLVSPKVRRRRRDVYVNMVRNRCVDFVLCDRKRSIPVLAIQLDRSTRGLRTESEELVARVLSAAEVPLLRLSAREASDPHELQAKLREAIGARLKAPAARAPI